jgi:hypothetical protein
MAGKKTTTGKATAAVTEGATKNGKPKPKKAAGGKAKTR